MELHFNVTGADRKKMVEAIANELCIKAKYLGVPSCAYQIGNYTVSKDGCLSFDDEEGISESSAVIDACVMAIGTSPAEWETNEPEQEEDDSNIHLDVSIPADMLNETQMANLQSLVDAKANLLKKAFDTNELPILKIRNEIHFPWLSIDTDDDRAQVFARFIEKLVEMARNAKRVTAKEKETENEKYAFRCFLLRLGFIGDEYKADRKILLSRLSGSSAFKSSKEENA